MNREIKFRGINTETGEWVYGTYLDGFIINGVAEATEEYICIEDWRLVREETVGQYTGLKDKHGKPIYEGDILTCEYYPFQDEGELNYNAEVFWSEVDSQFCVELHCVNPKKSGISNGICEGLTERGTEFEIIGNIWDNPELLEVQQ